MNSKMENERAIFMLNTLKHGRINQTAFANLCEIVSESLALVFMEKFISSNNVDTLKMAYEKIYKAIDELEIE